MPEPALFVVDSLSNLLHRVGVLLSRYVLRPGFAKFTSGERTSLYTYYSEPLKSILKETNYRSLNLYAENIFNYLALQKDSVATARVAANVISSYWKGKGAACTENLSGGWIRTLNEECS